MDDFQLRRIERMLSSAPDQAHVRDGIRAELTKVISYFGILNWNMAICSIFWYFNFWHDIFPWDAHFFFCIILEMKSLSNKIPFDFVLKIKFDWDFILKSDATKKWASQGNFGGCEKWIFIIKAPFQHVTKKMHLPNQTCNKINIKEPDM